MIAYLDSNIVIYAVENPAIFGSKALDRLAELRGSGAELMVSDLTWMECLIGPYSSGNQVLENQFRDFFSAGGIRVVAVSREVCDRAARIRSMYRFKPLDALHLAACAEHGGDVFLTHDTRLDSFAEVAVEVLS